MARVIAWKAIYNNIATIRKQHKTNNIKGKFGKRNKRTNPHVKVIIHKQLKLI